METMYHKGDVVVIRADLEVGCSFGNSLFIDKMAKFRGLLATISIVFFKGPAYKLEGIDYWWTNEMLLFPEYYEYVNESSNDFTEGKIYKAHNPQNLNSIYNFIDDTGRENGYASYNYEFFKPSTKEAFDAQNFISTLFDDFIHSTLEDLVLNSCVEEKDSSDEAFLKEAAKRYPIGTKFFPAHVENKDYRYCVVSTDVFTKDGDYIYACLSSGDVCNDGTKYGNTIYCRVVYSEGIWAEIIPEVKKWDIGTYVVFLADNLEFNSYGRGAVEQISATSEDSVFFKPGMGNSISGSYSVADQLAWFATREEAIAFASSSTLEVKKWAVGTYTVFLQNYGHSKKGDVDVIISYNFDSNTDYVQLKNEGASTIDSDWIQWFATEKEAVKFSKNLLAEAYEPWGVGTFVVCTKEFGHLLRGDIDEVVKSPYSPTDRIFYTKKEGVCSKKGNSFICFPTIEQAEVFAFTLTPPSLLIDDTTVQVSYNNVHFDETILPKEDVIDFLDIFLDLSDGDIHSDLISLNGLLLNQTSAKELLKFIFEN
ncbi:MAG: hypothetical protein ACOH2V_00685 [Candidatus Saccharimonadaceae bacterium]